MDFPFIDWEKNNEQLQQYTGTSNVGVNEPIPNEPGLSVILNNRTIVMAPSSVNFNSTVTAVVNEGVFSGDVITCGNSLVPGLVGTTNLTVNYIAICKFIIKLVLAVVTWVLSSYYQHKT